MALTERGIDLRRSRPPRRLVARERRAAALICALIPTLLVVAPPPASATISGTNGRISFYVVQTPVRRKEWSR